MKKKIDFRIPIIFILTIILIIMCCIYFKDDSTTSKFDNLEINIDETQTDIQSITTTAITSTISSIVEVESALTEDIELHATYYLEESYVEENQLVKAGENILKYTNGKYLTAPYDCIITKINIPDEEEKCTNSHYVEIVSYNALEVQFKVDETKISNITLGQSATIEIEAYEDKTINGTVTNISSTASNGKFTVTVEFENDGEIMIGMTANVTIEY